MSNPIPPHLKLVASPDKSGLIYLDPNLDIVAVSHQGKTVTISCRLLAHPIHFHAETEQAARDLAIQIGARAIKGLSINSLPTSPIDQLIDDLEEEPRYLEFTNLDILITLGLLTLTIAVIWRLSI
jgi:hypothetical protein